MPRKLNAFEMEPQQDCHHCGARFDKPYQRMPEAEREGVLVLRCPHCQCLSVFRVLESR